MESKYIDIAKERLAEYNLTIEDLTKEELAELLDEIEDEASHPGYLSFDGFLSERSLDLSVRKGMIARGEPVPDFLKNLAK